MTTTELERSSTVAEFAMREVANAFRENADLTLVYHRHGTAQHAEESTTNIEPRSVVFIEGYTFDSDVFTLMRAVEILSSFHDTYGVASQQYQDVKEIILRECQAGLHRPPQNSRDFYSNKAKEIQLLVEKDCFIYRADIMPQEMVGSSASLKRIYDQAQSDSEVQPFMLPEIRAEEGLGKSAKSFQDAIGGDRSFHEIREGFAATRTISEVGSRIWRARPFPDANTTPEGKIKTYVKYGTAHARSLTQKFLDQGIQPKLVVIDPIYEYEYMDPTEEFNNNFQRRVGFNAIMALMGEYLPYSQVDGMGSEVYSKLDYLNDDKEEFKKFVIRCLQVKKQQSDDEDGAYRTFKSIMRDVSADPRKFV